MRPRIGGCFEGYGGLTEGVRSVIGGELAWYSEVDKGALKILNHRFPTVPNLGDITTVDWSQVEPVDVLTGGSPCQDLSHAGKRQGMTEGTRSNLWVSMREAIAVLRPRLVVWENVRGAYSAGADSELESNPRLLADTRRRDGEPVLRALGRVLGDLSDLGYVGGWHGLRAADVGAPHGRFRVFVVAADADGGFDIPSSAWTDQRAVPSGDGAGATPALRPTGAPADAADLGHERGRRAWDGRPGPADGSLLPTPRATRGGSHTETVGLLPTPTSRDWKDSQIRREPHRPDDVDTLSQALTLLPTPAVNDMDEGKTPDAWDEWTDKMQAAHGNGNGHGKSLAIEAQRLLPTPTAQDSAASGGSTPSDVTLTDAVVRTNLGEKENPRHAVPTESGPGEELRDMRGATDSQEVRERTARGQGGLPQTSVLLPRLREHETGGHQGRAALASAEAQGLDVSGLWGDEAAARPSRGPQPSEQRSRELDDAVRELSPQTALARGSRCPHGCGQTCAGHSSVAWGDYEAAIRRWEICLGRPAPAPTRLSAKGNPQLAADFCEWLMGLPAGWVTDVPGITRNEALKALGNGVVPAQAAAAVRFLLNVMERAA